MPDSLPGSDFDDQGVCSWCRTSYPAYSIKGERSLRNRFKAMANHSGRADCIVGLSGGKDSTYALYRLVRHYGLKAEAFIYIHEGSRDFAIQNAERCCEALNVTLHRVSLAREGHKGSFLAYFKAWLSQPDVIAANMTCVACKHLHIMGSQIAVEARAPYIVWSSTPLEYSPFLALRHRGNQAHQFKREGALNGAFKLARQSLKSPALAKGLLRFPLLTVMGCAAVFPSSAYLRYRFPELKPLMFYTYEKWDPELILHTIRSECDWQTPDVIREDWHTDCLFNVFKEYMFQKMYGVSYTDSHLSNQIRHGYLTREQAIQKLKDSKAHYAAALAPALLELGAPELISQTDPECFKVDIS